MKRNTFSLPGTTSVPFHQVTEGTGLPPLLSHLRVTKLDSSNGPIMLELSTGEPSSNVNLSLIGRAVKKRKNEYQTKNIYNFLT